MDFLPEAFQGLAYYRQFICYKLVPSRNRPGKMDKIPIDRQGNLLNVHDSRHWQTVDQAITTVKAFGAGHGVGFVLTENDPFFCIDIDACADVKAGGWSPLANMLLNAFKGAAIEVSSSGQGLHILGSGQIDDHNCVNKLLSLEFYTKRRFIALTGSQAVGNVLTDCAPVLPWLVEHFFKRTNTQGVDEQWWSSKAHPDYRGLDDDDKLLAMALNSKSARAAFGQGASFADLFNADIDMLARAYPDANHACGYDENVADLALAQHLAFWTGNNAERMLRLMQRSKLGREKWQRPDYLPRTIRAACRQQTVFLKLEQPIEPPTDTMLYTESEVAIQGSRFIALEQQREFFKGCVYVVGEHKILIPGGDLLNPDRFRAFYGGHTFPLDAANEKITRNAWEAFTESQAFRHPRVHNTCFRPNLPPSAIIQEEGRHLVNQWVPLNIPRKKGDVGPFTNHVVKLIPNDRDRDILLSYFAAVVQHQGKKFGWCPYIQGVEGNGKTLLTSCLAFAVGYRYCHFPKASELIGKHNSWEHGKILIGVEDLCFGDKYDEIIEALKPMITNKNRVVEPKFVDQFSTVVCTNYIINSNHKDGLRKTMNDRRFAMFFTAQQSYDDLQRDGMLGGYFQKLYRWLEQEDGFAITAEYFYNYPINPEFNPATQCDRAPFTSCNAEAIAVSVGYVEQEILEAIEDNQPGFRGGWVSSKALDILLVRLRYARQIPPNHRRNLMRHLGYDLHPGLRDGRVSDSLPNGEGRPRLYTTFEHPANKLFGQKAIVEAYLGAQIE